MQRSRDGYVSRAIVNSKERPEWTECASGSPPRIVSRSTEATGLDSARQPTCSRTAKCQHGNTIDGTLPRALLRLVDDGQLYARSRPKPLSCNRTSATDCEDHSFSDLGQLGGSNVRAGRCNTL